MRDLEEICKEAEEICLTNNCQSWPVICVTAIEIALREFRDEIVDGLEDKF